MAARHRLILIFLLLAACGLGCRKKPDPPTVTINGKTWTVELATTDAQQYRGLSFRESLAADAGMLFVYTESSVLEFCMRDCLIPLDVAMIGSDLRVIKIHAMRVEADRAGTTPYSSFRPAQLALEVAGGSLSRAGVKVGDKVTLSGNIPFVPAAAQPDPSTNSGSEGPAKGAPRQ